MGNSRQDNATRGSASQSGRARSSARATTTTANAAETKLDKITQDPCVLTGMMGNG